jgi:hypothetical protein
MLGETLGEAIQKLLVLPGSLYSCVADPATGQVVAEIGAEGSLGASGAVLSWGADAARFLNAAAGDDLEDVMITSRRAYHLVRQVESGPSGRLLVYLCLDRARGNLAMARRELAATRLGELVRVAALESGNGLPPAAEPIGSDASRQPPKAPAVAAERRSGVGAAQPEPPPPELPRRAPAALAPPSPRQATEAEVVETGQEWANDPETLRMLLAALRKLV